MKCGDVMAHYLDTDQVSSLSNEYNRKRHFIRARPEGRFYENLVCIIFIIGSELDIMKNLLLHIKVYTLYPMLKACAKINSSKNAQNRQKRPKLELLCLVSRVARAPTIEMLFITSTRYSQKTSKIMDFVYTTPLIMVTWQAQRADQVLKSVLKGVQENYQGGPTCFFISIVFFNLRLKYA